MSLKSIRNLLCALAVASAGMAMAAPSESVKLVARQSSNCSNDEAVPFLRAYSVSGTDHFYTTDYTEMQNAIAGSYNYETEEGWVFREPGDSLVTFYRLYQPTVIDHFYTTDQAEADNAISELGYTDEGVAAYVYSTQICGSIPLYRLYNSNIYDHFYTTNETEREIAIQELSYSDEGISCYVLPDF